MMIYDLSSEYALLMEDLEDAQTDDERAEILDRLTVNTEQMTEQVEHLTKVVRNLEASAAACEVEEKRLKAKRQRAEKGVAAIKAGILHAMQATGNTKIKTDLVTCSVRTNDWSVRVVDANCIPMEFLRFSDPEPDKRALVKMFKETGEIIPGCEFEKTQSLSMR